MIPYGDEPTPCLENPWPFDVLMDVTRGPEWQLALLEASEMCAGCKVRVACHKENAAEPWCPPVAAKLRGKRRRK